MNTCFDVHNFKYALRPDAGPKPTDVTHEAIGTCQACQSFVVLFFRAGFSDDRGPESFTLPADAASINVAEFPKNRADILLVGQLPAAPKPDCPQFCPPNVERAFIEAEKACLAGAFTVAAGGYRKAVDRAITPFVEGKAKSKMLGHKLESLETSKLLPEPMLDWIRIVKDDGNFAMHDDDRDFETAEEIQPARDFTHTLLTYLYTLPERVRQARTPRVPPPD